jgi:hypothetical protein
MAGRLSGGQDILAGSIPATPTNLLIIALV